MSDAHAVEHPVAVASDALFTNGELREFVKEDISAGRAICQMLSILFIYTLFAMSFVGYWTYSSVVEEVSNRSTIHAPAETHEPATKAEAVEAAK